MCSQLLKSQESPDRLIDEATMSSLSMEVLVMLGQTIEKVVPITIMLALVFTVLSHFWACNPAAPWWRKREACDRYRLLVLRAGVRAGVSNRPDGVGASVVFNIHDADDLIAFYDDGHGPLAQLPLGAAALFLLLSDFSCLYWLHRMFHGAGSGNITRSIIRRRMWSGYRRALHPVNPDRHHLGRRHSADGGSREHHAGSGLSRPSIRPSFTPPQLALGPFRYVLATPVFHRASHRARRGRQHQLCRHVSDLGHSLKTSGCRPTAFRAITARTKSQCPPRSPDKLAYPSGNEPERSFSSFAIHSPIDARLAASGAGSVRIASPARQRSGVEYVV